VDHLQVNSRQPHRVIRNRNKFCVVIEKAETLAVYAQFNFHRLASPPRPLKEVIEHWTRGVHHPQFKCMGEQPYFLFSFPFLPISFIYPSCSPIHSRSLFPSSGPHLRSYSNGATEKNLSWNRKWYLCSRALVRFQLQWSWCGIARSENCLALFCCSSSAKPSSSLCHRWSFPSTSGVAYPLATRLWKLHIGCAIPTCIAYLQQQLQSVLNTAARLVFGLLRYQPPPMPSTGCVYHNWSTTKLRSWRFEH